MCRYLQFVDVQGSRGLTTTSPAILEGKQIAKNFGSFRALDGLDFNVSASEVFGIAGPNGAGKSTLLSVIAGTCRLSSGKVIFEGKEIQDLKPHTICRLGIARTFQTPAFFPSLTVRDNVGLALFYGKRSHEDAIEIADVLELVGLSGKGPMPTATMSLLEIKRLTIAICLATRPKLLMLDEIMAGLNPSEMGEVIEIVEELHKRGVTIIMIEHRMDVLTKLSTRLMIIHYGKRIALGEPEDVCEDQDVIECYLGKRTAAKLGGKSNS